MYACAHQWPYCVCAPQWQCCARTMGKVCVHNRQQCCATQERGCEPHQRPCCARRMGTGCVGTGCVCCVTQGHVWVCPSVAVMCAQDGNRVCVCHHRQRLRHTGACMGAPLSGNAVRACAGNHALPLRCVAAVGRDSKRILVALHHVNLGRGAGGEPTSQETGNHETRVDALNTYMRGREVTGRNALAHGKSALHTAATHARGSGLWRSRAGSLHVPNTSHVPSLTSGHQEPHTLLASQ
jgi:hypothetical protein